MHPLEPYISYHRDFIFACIWAAAGIGREAAFAFAFAFAEAGAAGIILADMNDNVFEKQLNRARL